MIENASKIKIITPARAAASRINGARSRGPVTIAGIEISSRNALKHGLNSTKGTLLLPGEDRERLAAVTRLLDSMASASDKPLVDSMVTYVWRSLRALEAENRQLTELASAESIVGDPNSNKNIARAWDELTHRPIAATIQRAITLALNHFRRMTRPMLRPRRLVVLRPVRRRPRILTTMPRTEVL